MNRLVTSVTLVGFAAAAIHCGAQASDPDIGKSAQALEACVVVDEEAVPDDGTASGAGDEGGGLELALSSDEPVPEDPADAEEPTDEEPTDPTICGGVKPPKPPKKCPGKSVRAVGGKCKANSFHDRTDTSNCTLVTPPKVGNWEDEDHNPGVRWQCGPSKPHWPCVPSATNGGAASHTHHYERKWNLGKDNCCFPQDDEIKVTCL